MCFLEFIGYVCGHCSPGVVRPCPLTTVYHTNPVCRLKALRPFMATTMCAACERILHTRKVLIIEWEHRFMHERGACTCQVIFPGLDGPRIAAALNSAPGGQEDDDNNTIKNYEDVEGKGKEKEVVETAEPATAHAPPMYQEVHGAGNPQTQYNIRVPSVYACEWLDDHRKLHDEGHCTCTARFSPYLGHEPLPTNDDGDLLLANYPADKNRAEVVQTEGGSSLAVIDPRLETNGAATVDDSVMTGPSGGRQVITLDQAHAAREAAQSTYPFTDTRSDWYTQWLPNGEVPATLRPEGVPFAGLPIGAGPEGEKVHTSGWDRCPWLAGRTFGLTPLKAIPPTSSVHLIPYLQQHREWTA